MPGEAKGKCATTAILTDIHENGLPKIHERQTWQWHPNSGHVRPAIREPGRIYCLDAASVTKSRERDGVEGPPMVNVCNPDRDTQLWVSTKRHSLCNQTTQTSMCLVACCHRF